MCLIGFRDRVGLAGVFDIRRPKIVFRRGSGEGPEGVQRGSEGLLAARPENGRWESVFWDPLGAVLGSFLGPSWRLGRRLGPTLVVLVRLKIDAKIDQFLNASWKEKWSQVGTQKRSKIEAAAIAEKPTKR